MILHKKEDIQNSISNHPTTPVQRLVHYQEKFQKCAYVLSVQVVGVIQECFISFIISIQLRTVGK